MEYEEYKRILDKALVDYVNNGGSVYYMGLAITEYFFEYENEPVPIEIREHLSNKAVQAILAKKPLPKGITLVNCILHERKGK